MVVEFSIGLVVGSLPTLRKLVVFRKFFGTSHMSNSYSEGNSVPGMLGSSGHRRIPLQNSVWSSRGNLSSTKPNTIHKTVEISRSESCERIIEPSDRFEGDRL